LPEMIHLPNLISDLALILGAAAIITLLFRKLRQPLVLGYLIAGFLVGPHFTLLPTISDSQSVSVWAEIGVIFLLFSLGLEFSFKKLIQVGAPASITAVVEVITMLVIGYVTGSMLGWSRLDSIFLGGVLSISSTTIIIRAFDELGVKGRKFAGLVFGILVVEDLVAIVLLVLLSTLAVSAQFAGQEMLWSVAKLGFFLMLWFLSGIFFIPTALRRLKSLISDETLLIISIALCLMMVWLATIVGFSPALGAFVMGSILAETTYGGKIEHLIKSVKDLFGSIFFVSVGMLIDPDMLIKYAGPVVLITVITIMGKTLSTTAGALLSGQSLKTSIQSGMSLAQIGEFSFIIATLGMTLKVTSEFLYPIAVAVSAVTTFTTPYMIKLSDPLYAWLNKVLPAKFINAVNRYSNKPQNVGNANEWQQFLRSHLLNTLLQMVIIIGIIIMSVRYLLPYIQYSLDNNLVARITAVLITFAFISPFLWALAIKQPKRETIQQIWTQTRSKQGLLVFQSLRFGLAIFVIGFLLSRFFTTTFAVISSAVLVGVMVAMSRKIQAFYLRIEDRFLSNFYEKENEVNNVEDLSPWDAHMERFEVRPEWNGIGKSLQALQLREKFGVNIASIERGNKTINVPKRNEIIFPYDSLLVIGTDEQLDRFRNDVELLTTTVEAKRSDVTLWHYQVNEGSVLVDKSIRESGIRERTRGIVVGVETEGHRIVNPDSSHIIHAGDVIWIVGDRLRLLSIRRAERANSVKS
jgi:CPA2 family monovalent cation:H+ antiporter-2